MEILNKIKDEYHRLMRRMENRDGDFPFETTPDNYGGEHMELSSDGKMALVGTERGEETARRETYSLDELMYWIFSDRANSKAFHHPSDPSEPYDFRERQQIALDEIGKISAAWRERLCQEQMQAELTAVDRDLSKG